MRLLTKYRLIFVLWFVLIINGCMMGMHSPKIYSDKSIQKIQSTNRSDKIENMLIEMIDNLSSKNFDKIGEPIWSKVSQYSSWVGW